MYCKNCGNLLTAEDKFCKRCGQPIVQASNNIPNLGVNNQPETPNSFQNVQQPVQPNNFSTPPPQRPIYNQPHAPKGSNNNFLFGVIGVLCVGLIIMGALFFAQKNNNDDLYDDDDYSDITDNGNDQDEIDIDTKVNYEGYTFSIPADYTTDEDVTLMVYDDTEEWMSRIGVFTDVTYLTIKNNISQLKGKLESTGIIVKSVEEKTINGNTWVMLEYTQSGYNILGGYGKTTNNNVVSLEVVNSNNTYDTNRFSEFEKICSSAKVSKNKGVTNPTTNKGVLSDLTKNLK